MQWESIGEFLAYGLDTPSLPEMPTPEELAPILKRTIKQTIRCMTPSYFCLLGLNYQMPKRSFVKVDVDAEGLEDDCDGILIAAIRAFLADEIDERTLLSVLALHEDVASHLLRGAGLALTSTDRRRITLILKRFGRCQPTFDWQPISSVRDGHTALDEDDTRRFVKFLNALWSKNHPVCTDDNRRLLRFRDFKLARKLTSASADLRGNCLVRYSGP